MKTMILLLVLVTGAHAASPEPRSTAASPSPVSTASASVNPRAEKLRAAKAEMATRYATRKKEAERILAELRTCASRLKEGPARRNAEKAITNLESGIAKAEAHAKANVFRKAFVALGRPAKAASAALKRCQSGAAEPPEDE